MTKASKIHLPRLEKGERHLTLCGRPTGTLAVAEDYKESTCGVCNREHARGNPKGAKQPSAHTSDGVPEVQDEVYSDKELSFAYHPDVVKNAYKAAIEAGYSESYAQKKSYALRERLYPLIRKVQEQRARKQGISAQRVQEELSNIAFANVLDYVEINEKTGLARPKGLQELTRQEASAIASYTLEPVEDDNGDTTMVLSKVTLIDKRLALIDLGKSIGMFNDKMQVYLRNQEKETRKVSLEEIPTDDLEQIEKILLAAKGAVVSQMKDRKAIPGKIVDEEK